ncbi:MAG: hypothetical protein LBL94_02115 [Prevotellaceae bacterium]|nr:hypothetical protein [Prevotellaceae bacterium]
MPEIIGAIKEISSMTGNELQEYLKKRFPIENERWEWKEFSRLKHFVKGQAGEDIASYISAIANMNAARLLSA